MARNGRGGGFTYRGGERTTEGTKRRQQSAGQSYDKFISSEVQTFKPGEGDNTVRILPQSGEVDWDIPVYIHYNVGPDKSTYLCLDKMGKKGGCPVCEARRETDDEDERDQLRVNERRLAWIVDREDSKAGPQVWSIPPSLYKDILGRSVDKKSGDLIQIDDPEEGYDVSFEREGADLRTKYVGIEVSREATPIHDKEATQEKWLAYIAENPLADLLVFFEPEYIEKVLNGQASDDDEDDKPKRGKRGGRKSVDDDEDEDDKPKRTRRGGRKAEADDDEDEEEDTKSLRRRGRSVDDDEDEDADEDKPPRRTTKGRKAAEEDEDGEEDEEDEKPKSRRRGKPEEDEEAEDEEDEKPAKRSRLKGVRPRKGR